MKILYIIDSLYRGGKERRLIQLLKKIDEKKNISKKLVILTHFVQYKQIHELNCELIILKRKIKKDPQILYSLYKICKKWRPDIIHAWGSMPAVYSAPIAKFLNIKLINAMIADAPYKLNLKKYIRAKLTFPFSDLIQSNSKAGLEAYSVNKKGNIIYNGFDFERIKNLSDPEIVKIHFNINTKYVVGMVGRFHPHKDYDTMLQSARIIIKKRDDVSFLLVGAGVSLEHYKKRFTENKIIFSGQQTDVESIINIFDIGILSTYTEGISNAILEYMALGKPVIATEGGGTQEIVINNETGFLIPQRNPKILVKKINYLLNNTYIRKEMGKKSKERIINHFNISKMIKEHIKIYNKVLDN